MSFEQYEHHGNLVWVSTELKGKHRNICLCHKCTKFFPGEEHNCEMAQENFEGCIKFKQVRPVLECPEFDFNWFTKLKSKEGK